MASVFGQGKAISFILVVLLCLPEVALSSSVLKLTVDQLSQESKLIFEGVVQDRISSVTDHGLIVTDIQFEVLDVIAGEVGIGELLTLRFVGGQYEGQTMDVGSVIPELGERGIYFAENPEQFLVNPLLGWSQGYFKIDSDGHVRTASEQHVTSIESGQSVNEKLSNGIAQGVKTRAKLKQSQPMTAEIFKDTIRGLR